MIWGGEGSSGVGLRHNHRLKCRSKWKTILASAPLRIHDAATAIDTLRQPAVLLLLIVTYQAVVVRGEQVSAGGEVEGAEEVAEEQEDEQGAEGGGGGGQGGGGLINIGCDLRGLGESEGGKASMRGVVLDYVLFK